MRGDFDEDEDPDFEPDSGGCNTCMGAGFIVTCVDDMCRGAGECITATAKSSALNATASVISAGATED